MTPAQPAANFVGRIRAGWFLVVTSPMSRFGKLELDVSPFAGREHDVRTGRGADHWCAEAWSAFARAEFEPAYRLFSRALEHDPDGLAAWTGQARALIELGDLPVACRWADVALERFPEAPDLLAAKAMVLGRMGRTDDALTLSDASLGPEAPAFVWLARGDVLLARGDPRADHCQERAFGIAPGDWTVPWLAARSRQHHRRYAAALAALETVLQLAPGQAAPWVTRGECQLALGFGGPAGASFSQALQLSPACRAAQAGLNALGRQGAWSRLAGAWRTLFRP